MKNFIVFFCLSICLYAQSPRETLVQYINSKLDFFAGKTDIGYMRFSVDVTTNDYIKIEEAWYINDITFNNRTRSKDNEYNFLPSHIKSIGVTRDYNHIEFHFKEDYYIKKNDKVITKIKISLEQAEFPEKVAKERIRLKNSLVFLLRNLIKKKI